MLSLASFLFILMLPDAVVISSRYPSQQLLSQLLRVALAKQHFRILSILLHKPEAPLLFAVEIRIAVRSEHLGSINKCRLNGVV